MLDKVIGIYRIKDKKTAPSTSAVELVGPKVGKNKVAKITFASIINYTSTQETVIIGIRDNAGKDHYIKHAKKNDPEDNGFGGTIVLIEGEAIFGLCPTPSASDVLYFVASGLIYALK